MTVPGLIAQPARYAVLVDAGYLCAASAALLLGTTTRRECRMDAEELIQSLTRHAAEGLRGELLRVYWFDAAKDRVPTVDQRVIAQLPWVKLRLGNVNSHGQQKGVDAQIRADLEALARHRAISDAVLLAGDEDMVPAVEAAQAYGVRIHLWGVEPPYGTNQAVRLVWEADTVEILEADFLRPYFSLATAEQGGTAEARDGADAAPRSRIPSPAQVFADRIPPSARSAVRRSIKSGKLGPDRDRIREIGEHVAQKWILTRGRDHLRDLLPGPMLPAVIDKELLIEAEKEIGHSLRPYQEARTWLRDGFWERIYREFDIGVGTSG